MDVSIADLVGELKVLRKGRGLAASRIDERAGAALRAVARVFPGDDAGEARRKLTVKLTELAAQLPADLGTAVLAAFGLHEHAQNPFYQDRVHWLAHELDRDDRTVRRRIDEAIERLAELAVALEPRPSRDHSWHTEELRVALALDRPVPETFVLKRIVADVDGVSELDLATTGGTGDVEVFHGGTLAGRALELPDALRQGERHDIALRFRAKLPHPQFVCVPRQPCDVFDLHLRFGEPRPVEVSLIAQAGAAAERLPLDRAGEVHIRFEHLTPGRAYGARWA